MNATYRLRSYYYAAVVAAFGVAAGFPVALCLGWNEPGPSEAAKLVLGALICCLSAFMTAMGIYLTIAVRRHRLEVTESEVFYQGIFRAVRFGWKDIVRARWRYFGKMGRVTLYSSSGKAAIDFDNYPRSDAKQLIRFFRGWLPESVQEGWNTFWPHYYQLFDEPDPARREAFAAETRALRWRMFAWCLTGTILLGAVALAVWSYTGDARSLAAILQMLFIWPLVFLVRADCGRLREKHQIRLKANPPTIAAIAGFLLTWLVFILLAFCGVRAAFWILMVGVCSSLALLILGMAIQSKRISRSRQAAAEEAERLYLIDRPRH